MSSANEPFISSDVRNKNYIDALLHLKYNIVASKCLKNLPSWWILFFQYFPKATKLLSGFWSLYKNKAKNIQMILIISLTIALMAKR